MTNPAGRSICLQDSLDNENIGRKLILAEVKFDLALLQIASSEIANCILTIRRRIRIVPGGFSVRSRLLPSIPDSSLSSSRFRKLSRTCIFLIHTLVYARYSKSLNLTAQRNGLRLK